MVNRVILIGNLGRDAEVRSLESGKKVAKVSIATNENYRDKDGEWQTQTEWHDLVMWGILAERAEKDLKKGDQIYIEGKLTHRKWQDAENNNRKSTEVVVSYYRQVGRTGNSGSSAYFPDEQDERHYEGMGKASTMNEPQTDREDEKDLPF